MAEKSRLPINGGATLRRKGAWGLSERETTEPVTTAFLFHMMSQVKICPDCETEYFAHVDHCADCGSALLSPDEKRKALEERERCREKDLEDQVVIREGDKKWINELYHALIDCGISCVITADAGCGKGCSADTRHLLVSRKDAEKAHERIEEYYTEVHPEIRASRDLMSQGKCPACGSPVGSEAIECGDCGLTLIIVE